MNNARRSHNISTSLNSNEIKPNINELIEKNNIDPDVFYSIKKMQQIPDDVILNFLNAESSLTDSQFKNRIDHNRD